MCFEQTTGYNDKKYLFFMNIFKKKSQSPGLMCKICKMEFLESKRTLRHMLKAHSKPQKSRV